MSKASPRPWRIHDTTILCGVWTVAVCHADFCEEVSTANAALIVEAVNAYDGLRDENERLRKLIQEMLDAYIYADAEGLVTLRNSDTADGEEVVKKALKAIGETP